MPVPVMQIRIMRMGMNHPLVTMPMRVRLDGRFFVMAMLMVFVMHVGVFVLQRLVLMFMVMTFGKMQPDADRHQHACQGEFERRLFMEQSDGG